MRARWIQAVRASGWLDRLLWAFGGIAIGFILSILLLYRLYASPQACEQAETVSVQETPEPAPSSGLLHSIVRWLAKDEPEDAGTEPTEAEDAEVADAGAMSVDDVSCTFGDYVMSPCASVPKSQFDRLFQGDENTPAACDKKGMVQCPPGTYDLDRLEDPTATLDMRGCKLIPYNEETCNKAKEKLAKEEPASGSTSCAGASP